MSFRKEANLHRAARSCARSSMLLPIVCILCFFPIVAAAQEPSPTSTQNGTAAPSPAETPPPTPTATPRKPVRISFLPPPLEGTISLGIYAESGLLVRILHQEAAIESFEAGDDALRTTWDGKSDAGEEMRPGRYHARGFLVGHEIKPQFVASHFGTPAPAVPEAATSLSPSPATSPAVAAQPTSATPGPTDAPEPGVTPVADTAIDAAPMVPHAPAPPPPVSRSGFTVENGVPLPHSNSGVEPPKEITVRLMENPLQNDRRASVRMAAGFNARGSFLRTSDGLPLRNISDDPAITMVLIWPVDSKTIDLFQDNGSKVDQLRLPRLHRMMAFDCGAFELK